jgi:glyceraldehyde 3-phosphate dehydrogenase
MSKKIRIAINGYGRIGRCVHRQVMKSDDIEVVAVNSRADAAMHAHLLKYDSVYGTFAKDVVAGQGEFTVDGQKVKVYQGVPGEDFKWDDLDIDVVIEATGRLTDYTRAEKHIDAGAKKVLVTAPCKDIRIPTFVMGVNDNEYNPEDKIVSNASCTTNCLAPVAKVLQEKFGIKNATMSTVHAATGSQNILDNSGSDYRKARSFVPSIIPTKTGVSSALGRVLPAVGNKFVGVSLRVPTLIVSLVDMTAELDKKVTVEEVNAAFEKASQGNLKGILGYETNALVSVDFKGDPRSTIVDAQNTKVVGDRMVKILSWYDNEWGYSARVVDLVRMIGS